MERRPGQVSQGFSVNACQLAGGSQDIGELHGRCQAIASDAAQAMISMAACAGHGGLVSALGGAAEQGGGTFLDIGAAYRRVDAVLTVTAQTYRSVEEDLAGRSEAIAGRMA
jgi:hypothetical protein